MDSNIQYLGGNLYQAVGSGYAELDNAILQDLTTGSVGLYGSSNQVSLTAGSNLYLRGDGNTVMGIGVNGVGVSLDGSGNTVMATGSSASVNVNSGSNNTIRTGANGFVYDQADGDMITVGANSSVAILGNNATVTAGQGSGIGFRDHLGTVTEATVNATNASISGSGLTASVSGDSNQIDLGASEGVAAWTGVLKYTGVGSTLNLSGSNNTIAAHLAPAARFDYSMSIATPNDSLTVQTDGSITMKGGIAPSVSLSGGRLTEQLANGNVVALDGVYSGVTLNYTNASGAQTSTTLMDSNLLSLGGSMYEVTGNMNAKMNNVIFSIDSGVQQFNTAGNSDQVYLSSATKMNLTGNGNTVVGSAVSGASVQVSGGANNVVALGANSHIDDYATGSTLTVGAGSYVNTFGLNTTVNARQGASIVTSSGSVTINGSNLNSVQLLNNVTALINGSGNSILCAGNPIGPGNKDDITLNGSNNSVVFYYVGGGSPDDHVSVSTSNGSATEQADGTIVLRGNTSFSSVSLDGSGNTVVHLSDGNVATFRGNGAGRALEYIDASGHATWSTVQATQQLVGAMAAYAPQSTGVGASFEARPVNDSQNMLVASH